MVYIPDRGDAIWINFEPQAGHEQAGLRPAVVLTRKSYNHRAKMLICCPITSQIKHNPIEVIIPDGLKVKGAILPNQVKSLDWTVRGAQFRDKIPDDVLEDVLAKIDALLR
jgi:mRNA interferase MazF